MAENFVNACVTAVEEVHCGGLDEVVSLARTWTNAIYAGQEGEVAIELSDGKVLRGRPHEDLRGWEKTSLVGMCADLDAAYKQIAIRKAHRCVSAIAVGAPHEQKPELFLASALPFGAIASCVSR